MKKMLLSAAAIACLFAACKKDDDNNNGGSNNSWKVGTTTYTATTVTDTLGGLWAMNANSNSLMVGFDGAALPTASGAYSIVETANAAMEVDVTAIVVSGTTGTFYSTGDNNTATATVSVTGGKVKVVIPEVWGYNPFDANDSMKISGTITQP